MFILSCSSNVALAGALLAALVLLSSDEDVVVVVPVENEIEFGRPNPRP